MLYCYYGAYSTDACSTYSSFGKMHVDSVEREGKADFRRIFRSAPRKLILVSDIINTELRRAGLSSLLLISFLGKGSC